MMEIDRKIPDLTHDMSTIFLLTFSQSDEISSLSDDLDGDENDIQSVSDRINQAVDLIHIYSDFFQANISPQQF